jgi:hypothetical protein
VKKQRFSFSLKSPGSYLLGLLTFLLLLTLSACGNTNSVRIYDNARVLNSSKVQNAASNLSNPIAIYTTNTFQGTEANFQRTAIQKLNGNPDMIVMAIDTNSRYIYIARGSHVPLSSNNINQAVNSFAGRFNNGDYTGASVAALNSMQSSISSSSQGRSSSSFNPLVPCLVLPLLLLLGVGLFAASRRSRMRGSGLWGTRRNPQFNEGPYYGPNQGPNQGYGPYNQGYGPPNQGGGMNPWAAGGLGAAAGGLAGYELGRRSGERDSDRNYDDNNDFGSGGGGNFGGNDPNGNSFGGGGNFGGDDPSGGGGNFGGGFGGSNLFGGGGNFGGGGGDDFGGGGNFGGGGGDDSGGSNF